MESNRLLVISILLGIYISVYILLSKHSDNAGVYTHDTHEKIKDISHQLNVLHERLENQENVEPYTDTRETETHEQIKKISHQLEALHEQLRNKENVESRKKNPLGDFSLV